MAAGPRGPELSASPPTYNRAVGRRRSRKNRANVRPRPWLRGRAARTCLPHRHPMYARRGGGVQPAGLRWAARAGHPPSPFRTPFRILPNALRIFSERPPSFIPSFGVVLLCSGAVRKKTSERRPKKTGNTGKRKKGRTPQKPAPCTLRVPSERPGNRRGFGPERPGNRRRFGPERPGNRRGPPEARRRRITRRRSRALNEAEAGSPPQRATAEATPANESRRGATGASHRPARPFKRALRAPL
jgi:hypothetical protein